VVVGPASSDRAVPLSSKPSLKGESAERDRREGRPCTGRATPNDPITRHAGVGTRPAARRRGDVHGPPRLKPRSMSRRLPPAGRRRLSMVADIDLRDVRLPWDRSYNGPYGRRTPRQVGPRLRVRAAMTSWRSPWHPNLSRRRSAIFESPRGTRLLQNPFHVLFHYGQIRS